MGYRWLVAVVVGVHFGYLAYLLLGGFLAWRWPRAIWPHLVASGWAVLIVLGWVDCPLTWAENWARQRAGEAGLATGFIDRYVDNVIYPDRYTNLVRAAVAVLVLGSWFGACRRSRAGSRRGTFSGRNAE